jgi:hypothetical protein
VSKGMDTQIKYKEVDKMTEVIKLIAGYKSDILKGAQTFTPRCMADIIEAIYKEKGNKIESVEIKKYSSVVKMILKSCGNLLGINIQVSDLIHAISLEKHEVGQLINILQQIHDQMD